MDATSLLALLAFVLALLAFVLGCLSVALTGAVFRPGRWYDLLAKPSWQPPKWLFGPVWTLLYLTIAVSGWLVWRKAGLSSDAKCNTPADLVSAG